MAEAAITFQRRYERLRHEGATRCGDCNEQFVSAIAVKVHKARGGCVQVPGARARLAAYLDDCLSPRYSLGGRLK